MFHTSVPIKVGRIYRLAAVEYGTHSFSTSTSFRMHSSSSFWSKHWEGKAKGEKQMEKYSLNILIFMDPYAKGNTSSGYVTVTVHRGS